MTNKMNEKTIVIFSNGQRSTLGQLLDDDANWRRMEACAACESLFEYCKYLEGKRDKGGLVGLVSLRGLRWSINDPFARFVNG